MQNVRPVIENFPQNDYSWVTDGINSKKTQIRRNRCGLFRENDIKTKNIILFEKLQNILSVSSKPKKSFEKKSLNYSVRKKEILRINKKNREIFKSLVEVKPSINIKKIIKWNESQERYKKNISCTSRRMNSFIPIVTQGLASAYPSLRAKTSSTKNRIRKLSADAFCIDEYSNILNLKDDNLEELKDNTYVTSVGLE